jgi:hypothetical protein
MKRYTVYFEFYGRKMKKTVMAHGEQHAESLIKDDRTAI